MAVTNAIIGYNCRITIDGGKVFGIGKFTLTGDNTSKADITEFGSSFKEYVSTLKEGSTLTFDGVYDPADIFGQRKIMDYQNNGVAVTDLCIYEDETNCWTMDTGSYCIISECSLGVEKSGIASVSFKANIYGSITKIQRPVNTALLFNNSEIEFYPNTADTVSGWFETDGSGDYEPRSSVSGSDPYVELDGNGDIMPK